MKMHVMKKWCVWQKWWCNDVFETFSRQAPCLWDWRARLDLQPAPSSLWYWLDVESTFYLSLSFLNVGLYFNLSMSLLFVFFMSFFLVRVCLHQAFDTGWMLVRCSRSRNLVCQDLGWFDYSLLFYLAEKGQQRIRLVWICIQATYSW